MGHVEIVLQATEISPKVPIITPTCIQSLEGWLREYSNTIEPPNDTVECTGGSGIFSCAKKSDLRDGIPKAKKIALTKTPFDHPVSASSHTLDIPFLEIVSCLEPSELAVRSVV